MKDVRAHAWFTIGIVLTVLAVSIAWSSRHLMDFGHSDTLAWMRALQERIELYQKEHGHYPASLHEVDGSVDIVGIGPIEYHLEGSSYVLIHLGSDHKPGGLGDAADIYLPENLQPPTTWYAYFFTHDFTIALENGLIWGAIAAGLWLLTRWMRKPPFPPLTRRDVVWAIMAVGLACVAAAFVLMIHVFLAQSAGVH